MANENDGNTTDTKQEVKQEAAATAAATPKKGPQPFVLDLRRPVIANGDETSQLSFREPTGADIEMVGNPVNLDFSVDPPKVSFDARAMTQMMARLAVVPPSTIRQMHPRDWNSAAWNLAGFFMPDT